MKARIRPVARDLVLLFKLAKMMLLKESMKRLLRTPFFHDYTRAIILTIIRPLPQVNLETGLSQSLLLVMTREENQVMCSCGADRNAAQSPFNWQNLTESSSDNHDQNISEHDNDSEAEAHPSSISQHSK